MAIKVLRMLSIIALSALLMTCNNLDSITENNTSVSNVAKALEEIIDINLTTEEAMQEFDSRLRVLSTEENDCKSIVHIPEENKIRIDYGNTSCILADGKSRQGKLLISYTGSLKKEGGIINIDFDNYYSSGSKIEGKVKVENQGNDKYKITLEEFKIPISDIDSIYITGEFQRITVEGGTTTDKSDDVFEYSGTLSGLDVDDQSFVVSTAVPLKVKNTCVSAGIIFPSSGAMQINTLTFSPRYVDFGDGLCDKSVILTVDSDSQTIRY